MLRGFDVIGVLQCCAGATGAGLAIANNVRGRGEAFGRDHDHGGAQCRGDFHQRVTDVVAIAHPRQLMLAAIKSKFHQCHVVRKRLAWMMNVGKRVDDWNCRICGKGGDGVLAHGARDNAVAPALKVAAVIGDGFALANAQLFMIQVDGMSTHAGKANIKTDARA